MQALSQATWTPQDTRSEHEQRVARARVSHIVAVRQAFAAMCRQDTSATRHTLVAVWARGDELMNLLSPPGAAATGEDHAHDPGRDAWRQALMAEALKDVPIERLRELDTTEDADADADRGRQMMFQAVQQALRDREPVELARRMADEAFEIFSGIDKSAAARSDKVSECQTILAELDAVLAYIGVKCPAARDSLDVFSVLDQAVQRGNQCLVKWRESDSSVTFGS
jgi:hypothetical protein